MVENGAELQGMEGNGKKLWGIVVYGVEWGEWWGMVGNGVEW